MERSKSAQIAKHYANAVRNKLSQRHKNTDEVRDIMNGQGFKQTKPKYISKPDIIQAEVQHQHLNYPANELIQNQNVENLVVQKPNQYGNFY